MMCVSCGLFRTPLSRIILLSHRCLGDIGFEMWGKTNDNRVRCCTTIPSRFGSAGEFPLIIELIESDAKPIAVSRPAPKKIKSGLDRGRHTSLSLFPIGDQVLVMIFHKKCWTQVS